MIQKSINGLFSLWCSIQNKNPFLDVDQRLHIQHFFPNVKQNFETDGSPSRVLSNLFWRELPWNLIKQELGELHILDTGCGSGSYGDYLDTCSNGNVARYVGLDVYEHPSWKTSTSPNREFHRFNGRSIAPHIPADTNFFMSQSAIEHFPNDHRYFKDVQKFVDSRTRPLLQIHLFPSVACLHLYGRHGYRQYTPRTVSKNTRLFPTSQCILFGLGGPACNRVHKTFITDPLKTEGVDHRKTKSLEYQQELMRAIEQDKNVSPTDPSFWALVICSNWKLPFVI